MIDMKIDQYHITSDRYEVRVSKMNLDDNGQPVITFDAKNKVTRIQETPLSHCNNLADALNWLKRYLIRTGSERITTVDQLRRETLKIERQFDAYVKERVPEGM